VDKNHALTQSPSLFNAPGTEALAHRKIIIIVWFSLTKTKMVKNEKITKKLKTKMKMPKQQNLSLS